MAIATRLMDKDTLLYKALQMPARYLPILVLLWLGTVAGLIYWAVTI